MVSSECGYMYADYVKESELNLIFSYESELILNLHG
jgi:hypothetical protein